MHWAFSMHSVFVSGSLTNVWTEITAAQHQSEWCLSLQVCWGVSTRLRHDLNGSVDLEWPSNENRVLIIDVMQPSYCPESPCRN